MIYLDAYGSSYPLIPTDVAAQYKAPGPCPQCNVMPWLVYPMSVAQAGDPGAWPHVALCVSCGRDVGTWHKAEDVVTPKQLTLDVED